MSDREQARREQERRIARVIEEYDRQGWHRSGTEVDAASARWLAGRVAGCGPEPTVESVRCANGFARLVLDAASEPLR